MKDLNEQAIRSMFPDFDQSDPIDVFLKKVFDRHSESMPTFSQYIRNSVPVKLSEMVIKSQIDRNFMPMYLASGS